MRRWILVFTSVVVAAWIAVPAIGARGVSGPTATSRREISGPRTSGPVSAVRALADRDADGVSDELDARLERVDRGGRTDVIVLHDGTVSAADAARAVGRIRSTERFEIIDGFAARLTAGQVRTLAQVPGVERVQSDAVAHVTDASSGPDYGATGARGSFGVDGSGTRICVLDTGADPDHEQLANRIVAFEDFIGTGTTPYDDHGHGTHVASIAAGDGTGGPDAAANVGVAPGAALVVGKVLAANGSGTTQQIVGGIEWCAGLPSVDVITMSLGTSVGSDGQDALSLAVDAAVDAGKVVTVAAGNSGDLPMSVGAPGASAKAITVGAGSDWSAPTGAPNHDDGVSLAYFSSRGPTLDGRIKPDVVGPGTTITAAEYDTTGGYATYSGTSMATPYAAGAAALAIDAGMSPTDVKQAMRRTAQDRGPTGADPDWGAGLLDVRALVAQAAGGTAATTFPADEQYDGSVSSGGTWTRTFEVGPDGLDVPIAATIVIGGECLSLPGFGCLPLEWSPDLDARLRAPDGSVLDESTCALGDGCGQGRQETLHAMPTVAGTYQLEVFPYGAAGGSFSVDLSHGTSTGPSPSPSPTPTPTTVHVGDLDGAGERLSSSKWRARVVVVVHDDLEVPNAGVQVAVRFGANASLTCTTNDLGRCSVSKRYQTSKAKVTATVLGLVGQLPYDGSANHDADGDSNGTSIVVLRP